MRTRWLSTISAAITLSGTVLYVAAQAPAQNAPIPVHPQVAADKDTMVVQLCDGETHLELAGIRPEQRLAPKQAQEVADRLMTAWYEKQPPEVAAAWKREEAAVLAAARTAPSQAQAKQAPEATEQPVDFSARDQKTWQEELEREIAYGNQIFHDDKLLGSVNGVACAMCHPHAANTHPETYPKFQNQLKRVALLRDMINWCMESPSRAPRLDPDDPKLRALEAYILSQRKGATIEPGKH